MSIIKQLRRLVMPPCSQCRWSAESFYVEIQCENPKGLDLLERLTGLKRRNRPKCSDVRGTRYCNFKAKEVDDGVLR